jgi:Spy/CpxP family protein refolding chaperone
MRRATLLTTLAMLAVSAVTIPAMAQAGAAPRARHGHEMHVQRHERRDIARDRADLRRDRRDLRQDRRSHRMSRRAARRSRAYRAM